MALTSERPAGPSGKRHRMVFPWLSAEAYAALEAAAVHRKIHRDVLAAQLLERVCVENLFLAVLDC